MQKLTLSVDAHVVQNAKRYARGRGTSVSRLVETVLRLVASSAESGAGAKIGEKKAVPPVLARLRGSLARGDRNTYRRYLEHKYR